MEKFVRNLLIITLLVVLTVCCIGYYYKDQIYIFYKENILKVKENIKISKNEYYNDNDYNYVKNTDDFIAKDKEHLLNIFYTIINSGTQTFTFYCDDNYSSCINDVVEISQSSDTLSNINNFVHPFNSFSKIATTYTEYGEVTIIVTKTYTSDEILYINNAVDKIINNKIKKSMTSKEKMKEIHDYIINNSKYATDKVRDDNPDAEFNKADYVLESGYGTCNSYADLMGIFLYRFGINNVKISSESHIWNLVYWSKDWYHIDLTWDDPVMSDGSQRLEDLFFLITSNRLSDLNVGEHSYNKSVFKEAK